MPPRRSPAPAPAPAPQQTSWFKKAIKIGLVAGLGLFGYKAYNDGVNAAVDSTKDVMKGTANVVKNTGSGVLNTLKKAAQPRPQTPEEIAIQKAKFDAELAKYDAKKKMYERQGQAQDLQKIVNITGAAYQGTAYIRGATGNLKTTERIIQGKKVR